MRTPRTTLPQCKLFPQTGSMRNMLQGHSGQVVSKKALGFVPDRNLTTHGAIAASPFFLFKTAHESQGSFKTFVDFFEIDLLGRAFERKSSADSHIGLDKSSAL